MRPGWLIGPKLALLTVGWGTALSGCDSGRCIWLTDGSYCPSPSYAPPVQPVGEVRVTFGIEICENRGDLYKGPPEVTQARAEARKPDGGPLATTVSITRSGSSCHEAPARADVRFFAPEPGTYAASLSLEDYPGEVKPPRLVKTVSVVPADGG